MEISDHHLIYLVKKKITMKKDRISISGRDYKKMDEEKLTSKLATHNWGRFVAMDCPILAWEYFFKIVCDTVNEICPIKEFLFSVSRPPLVFG